MTWSRYIHHLLLTQELTGQILLARHNLQHYLAFFRALRGHVAKGTFAAYMQQMLPHVSKE
jgi:tRNA-guanine family transglycosylase|eukprot:COSAG01_NODE_11587_length_1898_cov_4.347415_2_plen_61_part_00